MNKIGENSSGMQTENNIARIFKGSILSIVITLVLLLIYSLVLTLTSIAESTINTVTIIITCISILIGSSFSTIKIKQKGIINGGLVGLTYILVVYLFSSIVQTGFVLNTGAIIIMVASIVAGMLGGIIGVNLK